MRGGLRTAAGVTLAWLAVGAVPAAADTQGTVSGTLAIAWHGDAARGCAQVGLCGTSGAVQASAGFSAVGVSSGTPPVELQDDAAVVRVNGAAADGSLHQCADIVPIDVSFRIVRSAGPPHAVIDTGQAVQSAVAGRCAGPTLADLAALRLPARALAHGWDLSGTVTFGAGPFEAVVRSTLRASFGPASSGPFPFSGPLPPRSLPGPKPRRVLEETVQLAYRVGAAQTPLEVAFSGSAAPLCAPLGACGTTGVVSTTVTGGAQDLLVFGSRVVTQPVSKQKGLADLRAGRLTFGNGNGTSLRVRTSESVLQAGGAQCRDQTSDELVSASSRSAHGVEAIVVDPAAQRGGFFGPFSAGDALRTRCAGPSSDDVLGAGPLATGSIPISRLGDRHLTLALTARGAFRTRGYQGALGGQAALALTLRRVVVRTARVPLFPGGDPRPMTTRRTMLGIATAVAVAAGPAAARAQSLSLVSGYAGGGVAVAQFTMPVLMSGEAVVSFHGDARTGCAARGLCGASGTVYWEPSRSGALEIIELRRNHRTTWAVSLVLPGNGASLAGGGAATTARVQLSPADLASSCNDVQQSNFFQFPTRRRQIVFSFAQAGAPVLQTRCAGPLTSDLGPAWPAPVLSAAAATRGRTTLDLSGTRSFAANGFAGTVDSTLRMQLGRSRSVRNPSGNSTPSHPLRIRNVEVSYQAAIRGSVLVAVSGDPNPAFCAPLGSCGLTGSVRVMPVARNVTGTFDALARADRPRRDLLAALGLSRTGRAVGIFTIGSIDWQSGGTVAASVRRGAIVCQDTAAEDGGLIRLQGAGRALNAQFSAASTGSDGGRTRCPGPYEPDAALASARVPLRVLARRVATIPISNGTAFIDDGYSGRTIPRLTLTLTRTRVRTTESSIPSP